MRRCLPYTNTHIYTKLPNRIEALQLYYNGYFDFVQRNLEPIPKACDLATAENKANKKLQAIKSTIQFVLKAINKMATSVRMDLSSIHVNNSSFELGIWLEDLLNEFNEINNLDENDEVTLYIKNPLSIARLESDAIMLKQVLTYLLRNAIRFSEEGTDVKLKCMESGSKVVIEVHNAGVIATEDKQKLFVPYLKAEEEMRDAGLGLYICSLYIEALNGTIDARCENDNIVFSIVLPGPVHYRDNYPDL